MKESLVEELIDEDSMMMFHLTRNRCSCPSGPPCRYCRAVVEGTYRLILIVVLLSPALWLSPLQILTLTAPVEPAASAPQVVSQAS